VGSLILELAVDHLRGVGESIADEREAGRGISAGGLEDQLEVDGVLVHNFAPIVPHGTMPYQNNCWLGIVFPYFPDRGIGGWFLTFS
jgi:hypothetical protein